MQNKKKDGNNLLIQKISDDKKPLKEIVDINNVSLDVVEASDYREKVKTAFNRIYYISDGYMQLFINGQEIALQKGDACFVEKGTTLELQGTFTVMIVSQPALRYKD